MPIAGLVHASFDGPDLNCRDDDKT